MHPPPPSNFLGLRFLASLFARRNTEGSNCVSGNAVGKATVSSGTSVVVTVTAREGTSNYHAQVVDEAGNRGPCSQVFEHTNTGGILEVTGLTTDKNPRRFKSWEWGCTTEKTLPCEYRHTINNKATHLFDSKATYSANNRANTTGKTNNLWYLHVQAKNTKRESNVKSVSVRIDRTSPETPNAGSVTYKVLNSRLHSLEVTFRDLILRDRVYLYNTSNCQGSSLGTARVTNNNQAVITFKATGNRQKYYAQVVDEADNRSGCGEVFTYPDNVLPVLPAVTGLANDKTPRKIKTWEWGCTTESMDPPHTCEYRHTINDKATHTFAEGVEYSLDNEASTRGKADDKWSLHVQAKNRAGASSVKSVSVTIDNTAPKTPDNNSMTFRATDNHQVTVTFSDTGILPREHIYIYDVSTCRERTLGNSVVDNNNRAVITFNAGSTPKRYYANIIDQAGNKGGCGYLFAYPSGSAFIPQVTGLTNDDVPRQRKTWQWGCSVQGCTYRHAINRERTHTFESGDAYSTTTEATKEGASGDNGRKYYIHVQAKTDAGESRVKTVYANLDKTPPATPTKDSIVYVVRPARGDNPEQIVIQFSNLDPGDTVRVYTMQNGQASFHLGTGTVASDETSVSVTVDRRPGQTDYCARVTDRAKNTSAGCGLILTYPEPSPRVILKIPMTNPSLNYLHDQPTFTVEKASGNKIELYAYSGASDCGANCCVAGEDNNVEKVASKTCPTTGACTIQVGENIDKKLKYPDGVNKHKTKYTFYVKKDYKYQDDVTDSKCSSDDNEGESDDEVEKKKVTYNLWPYQAIHVGGRRRACHLSKLGEIRCWGQTVGGIFNRCLPRGGTFKGTKQWLASFNPLRFANPIDLGCRPDDDGEPQDTCSSNEKYKALAISVSHNADTNGPPNSDYYNIRRGTQRHICAILDDQKVKCWGDNTRGQLLLGALAKTDAEKQNPASLPVIALTVKAISAGAAHTCAIINNNDVKCWGDNKHAQLGLNLAPTNEDEFIGNTDAEKESLRKVELGDNLTAKAISAGEYHTCAIVDNTSATNHLEDDRVRCWGDNRKEQIKAGDANVNYGENNTDKKVQDAGFFETDKKAKKVFAGHSRTCIIKMEDSTENNPDVICRSSETWFQDIDTTSDEILELSDSSNVQTIKFDEGDNRKILSLSLGRSNACILSSSGEAICFGRPGIDSEASQIHWKYAAEDLNRTLLGQNLNVQSIATSKWNNCAALSNGHVNCWGAQHKETLTHDKPHICENDAPSP